MSTLIRLFQIACKLKINNKLHHILLAKSTFKLNHLNAVRVSCIKCQRFLKERTELINRLSPKGSSKSYNQGTCGNLCLVPRPQYFAAGSGPGRSSRLRHRNQLTVKAWEKAVQELGNTVP